MSNQSESAGLGGRLRRYAKVSGAVGGLAARVAGERYLGVSFDRANHAAELTADEKNLISDEKCCIPAAFLQLSCGIPALFLLLSCSIPASFLQHSSTTSVNHW